MYFLMWDAEIDMEKWSEAVTHASEYRHFSHAVNNDALHCLLVKPSRSLGESCQGNREWNESTVGCQEGRGGWEDTKTENQFIEQIFRFVINCVLRWMVVSGRGEGQNSKRPLCSTAFSHPLWHLEGERRSYLLSGWWETLSFLNGEKNHKRGRLFQLARR